MPKGGEDAVRTIAGVRLWIVRVNGQEVPVVDLEKSSIFNANASWLIQQALDSSVKAESEFEYCVDREITKEVKALRFSKEDIFVARMTREDLTHMRAVGVAGKRSVMMACLVALYRDPGRHTMNHKAFWEALQDYELDGPFEDIIATVDGHQNGDDSSSYGPSAPTDRGSYNKDGVELNIILGNVPVVNLEAWSPFEQSASWLIQAATGTTGKADGLYEYIDDKRIELELRDSGLTAYDFMAARLKSRPDIVAVGTNGKRSIMLALTVALALRDNAASANLKKDIMATDRTILEPLGKLLKAAHTRCSGKPEKGAGKGRRAESRESSCSRDARRRGGKGIGLRSCRSRSRQGARGGYDDSNGPRYSSRSYGGGGSRSKRGN